MDYIERIQSGIDFVELHLDSNITTEQVAREAGLSQWHFQRIFKATTNETLKSYIRARRLARSLELLLETDLRIIDIALSTGYENQESYTRAFKKSFGMTPGHYRKIGDRALFLKKVQITDEYLKHIQANVSLAPEIKHQPTRRLIGLRTYFYGVDSDKNNIADKLHPLWDSFLSRLTEIPDVIAGTCYGAIQETGKHTDQLNYVAGIEVRHTASIPTGMEEIIIPACTYARFRHRGEVTLLDNTVNFIYSNWLLNSTVQHNHGPDLEIYGTGYHPTSADSIIHYEIPIDE